jgi:hypothetical protein
MSNNLGVNNADQVEYRAESLAQNSRSSSIILSLENMAGIQSCRTSRMMLTTDYSRRGSYRNFHHAGWYMQPGKLSNFRPRMEYQAAMSALYRNFLWHPRSWQPCSCVNETVRLRDDSSNHRSSFEQLQTSPDLVRIAPLTSPVALSST